MFKHLTLVNTEETKILPFNQIFRMKFYLKFRLDFRYSIKIK